MAGFWRDRVVIITGASSGIGLALAEFIAKRGGKVGMIGRDATRLAESQARLGTNCEACAADVTAPEALYAAVARIEARLGPCDILIASAGIHRYTNGRKLDAALAAEAAEMININVCGVINAFAAVLPGMVARKTGTICAVSSLGALVGLPTSAAYSASKAAVLNLCDGLRVDLKPAGVRVVAIGPGFVDTPMLIKSDRIVPRRLRAVPATDAAARIATAVERGDARCFFPRGMWLRVWVISKLPPSWFAALWGWMVRRKGVLQTRGDW